MIWLAQLFLVGGFALYGWWFFGRGGFKTESREDAVAYVGATCFLASTILALAS